MATSSQTDKSIGYVLWILHSSTIITSLFWFLFQFCHLVMINSDFVCLFLVLPFSDVQSDFLLARFAIESSIWNHCNADGKYAYFENKPSCNISTLQSGPEKPWVAFSTGYFKWTQQLWYSNNLNVWTGTVPCKTSLYMPYMALYGTWGHFTHFNVDMTTHTTTDSTQVPD